jgi:hypothetical protein
MKLITDDQSLVSATCHGSPLPINDDGYGPLFVYSNEFGAVAVIRAQTWGDAYSICEDEFMDSATWADVLDAYPDAGDEDGNDYTESFGHRPSGSNGPGDEGLYHKSDYERLDQLTLDLIERLGITLNISDPEPDPEPPQEFHSFHLTRRPMSRRGLYVAQWSGRYGTKGSDIFACHKRGLARHDAW